MYVCSCFQSFHAEKWPRPVLHRGSDDRKKHLTDWAGTFSDVIPIDHAIFSSAVYEWRSAAGCLEPAEMCWWDFWGEKSVSLKVFHRQQRVPVRQRAAEPRLTLLQGRARAQGRRSGGKEVRAEREPKQSNFRQQHHCDQQMWLLDMNIWDEYFLALESCS